MAVCFSDVFTTLYDVMKTLCEMVLVMWWLVLTVYYCLESLVLLVVPRKYKSKDVRGSVALVTGGGSGIGRLMCIKLAQKGALVVTWDVNEKDNKETVQRVKEAGGQCLAYTVDLRDRHAVYATATKVKEEVGKVDILINNAGIVTGKPLLQCPDTSIIKTFEVNSISHFWTTKAFLGDMVVRNKGHIVTIASALGKTPFNSHIDYCTSKHAAVGFHESLRIELNAMGKFGIKTTVVCPAHIALGVFEDVVSKVAVEPDHVAEEVVNAIELNVSVLYVPFLKNFDVILKIILPAKSFYKMQEVQGYVRAMDTFVERQKTYLRQDQRERERECILPFEGTYKLYKACGGHLTMSDFLGRRTEKDDKTLNNGA